MCKGDLSEGEETEMSYAHRHREVMLCKPEIWPLRPLQRLLTVTHELGSVLCSSLFPGTTVGLTIRGMCFLAPAYGCEPVVFRRTFSWTNVAIALVLNLNERFLKLGCSSLQAGLCCSIWRVQTCMQLKHFSSEAASTCRKLPETLHEGCAVSTLLPSVLA